MTRRGWIVGTVLVTVLLALVFWFSPEPVAPMVIDSPSVSVGEPASRNGKRVVRLEPFEPAQYLVRYPAKKGAPLRFAEREEVEVTPRSHGVWERDGAISIWRLEIEAPGALNLNLGFSEYALPKSAQLEMHTDLGLAVRPFTADDNDEHGELWTPAVFGDRMELVLRIAEEEREDLILKLRAINRGFRSPSFVASPRKLGGAEADGTCYIDTVCSAEESGVGPAIDAYRDQMRSAGVYTLQGIETCSGAAINNVRHDETPLFLTAQHCQINASNAASVVVFWNHENSSCRERGGQANVTGGDAPITDFNTGAIFRAAYAPADAALIELDDPLDPSHQIFLAGWSITSAPSMGVAVHFPSTTEKRVSFDFDPLVSTNDSDEDQNPDGTHWRVVDWDVGSTEFGSSGSPLFDQHGRVVGQLSGGFAECGNDASDWYGKIAAAWEGGGTPSSRLKDWLDPDGNGVEEIDGIDSGAVLVSIDDAAVEEGNGGEQVISFKVQLSEPASELITLSYEALSHLAVGAEDYEEAESAPLQFEPGEELKEVVIAILGDATPEEDESFMVKLTVVSGEVILSRAEAIGTIVNDDFIPPVIGDPVSWSLKVGEIFELSLNVQNTPREWQLQDALPGMTLEGGVLRWQPVEMGMFEVLLTVENPAGSDERLLTFAVDNDSRLVALDSGGGFGVRLESDWQVASGGTVHGPSHLESAPIGDNERSVFSVEVTGPDYLGFWWRVSSEEDFDIFSYRLDGELQEEISGEESWRYRLVYIPRGDHVVSWTYEKDSSASDGEDRGMLDLVQLSSRARPFLMERTDLVVRTGEEVAFQFTTAMPGARFVPRSIGGGLQIDEEGRVTGTPSAGPRVFPLVVEQGGQTLSLPASIDAVNGSDVGAAVNQPELLWRTDGAGSWQEQGESRDGVALRIGAVPDGESGSLSTWIHGPGKVSFWWKVSSEGGFDGLAFRLDGREQRVLTGEEDWQNALIDIPVGWHELRWVYFRDPSDSGGENAGWLDEISFEGYAGWVQEHGLGMLGSVTRDGEGDGLSQLFEYATGGSPWEWESVAGPGLVEGRLEWQVVRDQSRAVTFEAEASGGLADWNRVERSILQDDASLFHVRDEAPVGSPERFLRLLVFPGE